MNYKFFSIIVLLYVFGCAGGGGSMEFTSAKTAARTEKNTIKAEEWGIKALNVVSDSTNALVPYFLAVEVYRPQKKWLKMAEMFDEAIRRNPKQKLDKPKYLIDPKDITKENVEESIAYTVEQGVNAYRKQEWAILFNMAVESIQNNKLDKGLEYLIIAKAINPNVDSNYEVMAEIYIGMKDMKTALSIAKEGLQLFPSSSSLFSVIGRISYENGDFVKAEEMLKKSLELSKGKSDNQLMKILSYVYIDLGKTNEAIMLSKNLLDKNPDDPLLYYNLAVIYQRLVSDEWDIATNTFNSLMADDSPNPKQVIDAYNKFDELKKHVLSARENFLISSDLSIDEKSAKESMNAAREMRRLLMQINDIYLPSLNAKVPEN